MFGPSDVALANGGPARMTGALLGLPAITDESGLFDFWTLRGREDLPS